MNQAVTPHVIRALFEPPCSSIEMLGYCRTAIAKARSTAAQRIRRSRQRASEQRKSRLAAAASQGFKTGVLRSNVAVASCLAPILALEEEIIKGAHRDCLEVALCVAREVVGEAASTLRDVIAERVSRALKQLSDSRKVTVTLPEGAPRQDSPDCQFEYSPSLMLGEVLIRTHSGKVLLSALDEFDAIAELLRARTASAPVTMPGKKQEEE